MNISKWNFIVRVFFVYNCKKGDGYDIAKDKYQTLKRIKFSFFIELFSSTHFFLIEDSFKLIIFFFFFELFYRCNGFSFWNIPFLNIYIYMRDATSTTILQHFYNKSQVGSCYWFEFETNSKITFLSQQ